MNEDFQDYFLQNARSLWHVTCILTTNWPIGLKKKKENFNYLSKNWRRHQRSLDLSRHYQILKPAIGKTNICTIFTKTRPILKSKAQNIYQNNLNFSLLISIFKI